MPVKLFTGPDPLAGTRRRKNADNPLNVPFDPTQGGNALAGTVASTMKKNLDNPLSASVDLKGLNTGLITRAKSLANTDDTSDIQLTEQAAYKRALDTYERNLADKAKALSSQAISRGVFTSGGELASGTQKAFVDAYANPLGLTTEALAAQAATTRAQRRIEGLNAAQGVSSAQGQQDLGYADANRSRVTDAAGFAQGQQDLGLKRRESDIQAFGYDTQDGLASGGTATGTTSANPLNGAGPRMSLAATRQASDIKARDRQLSQAEQEMYGGVTVKNADGSTTFHATESRRLADIKNQMDAAASQGMSVAINPDGTVVIDPATGKAKMVTSLEARKLGLQTAEVFGGQMVDEVGADGKTTGKQVWKKTQAANSQDIQNVIATAAQQGKTVVLNADGSVVTETVNGVTSPKMVTSLEAQKLKLQTTETMGGYAEPDLDASGTPIPGKTHWVSTLQGKATAQDIDSKKQADQRAWVEMYGGGPGSSPPVTFTAEEFQAAPTNAKRGDANYDPKWDLDGDGTITQKDVNDIGNEAKANADGSFSYTNQKAGPRTLSGQQLDMQSKELAGRLNLDTKKYETAKTEFQDSLKLDRQKFLTLASGFVYDENGEPVSTKNADGTTSPMTTLDRDRFREERDQFNAKFDEAAYQFDITSGLEQSKINSTERLAAQQMKMNLALGAGKIGADALPDLISAGADIIGAIKGNGDKKEKTALAKTGDATQAPLPPSFKKVDASGNYTPVASDVFTALGGSDEESREIGNAFQSLVDRAGQTIRYDKDGKLVDPQGKVAALWTGFTQGAFDSQLPGGGMNMTDKDGKKVRGGMALFGWKLPAWVKAGISLIPGIGPALVAGDLISDAIVGGFKGSDSGAAGADADADALNAAGGGAQIAMAPRARPASRSPLNTAPGTPYNFKTGKNELKGGVAVTPTKNGPAGTAVKQLGQTPLNQTQWETATAEQLASKGGPAPVQTLIPKTKIALKGADLYTQTGAIMEGPFVTAYATNAEEKQKAASSFLQYLRANGSAYETDAKGELVDPEGKIQALFQDWSDEYSNRQKTTPPGGPPPASTSSGAGGVATEGPNRGQIPPEADWHVNVGNSPLRKPVAVSPKMKGYLSGLPAGMQAGFGAYLASGGIDDPDEVDMYQKMDEYTSALEKQGVDLRALPGNPLNAGGSGPNNLTEDDVASLKKGIADGTIDYAAALEYMDGTSKVDPRQPKPGVDVGKTSAGVELSPADQKELQDGVGSGLYDMNETIDFLSGAGPDPRKKVTAQVQPVANLLNAQPPPPQLKPSTISRVSGNFVTADGQKGRIGGDDNALDASGNVIGRVVRGGEYGNEVKGIQMANGSFMPLNQTWDNF